MSAGGTLRSKLVVGPVCQQYIYFFEPLPEVRVEGLVKVLGDMERLVSGAWEWHVPRSVRVWQNKGIAMALTGDTENKYWGFWMGCGFHLISALTNGGNKQRDNWR